MRAPKLREATLNDYEAIHALKSEYGFISRTRDEWDHFWKANPAYQKLEGRWPVGWVLEAGSRIVGCMANILTEYELADKELFGASGHGWAVVPEYRGYSLLLMEQYIRQNRADVLVTNTANEHAFRLLKMGGLTEVPLGTWDKSALWITNCTEFMAGWMGRKNFRAPGLLCYPAALALSIKELPHRARVKAGALRGTRIELCPSFDQRFEEFWGALRRLAGSKLLAVRSQATLQWHFRYPLIQNRAWILTASRGSQLLAYSVILLQQNAKSGVRKAVIADFQALQDGGPLFTSMLEFALQQCRRSGIHLLQTTGFSVEGTDWSRLAPYHVPQPNWIFVYKAQRSELASALANPGVWNPSLYDSDATL